MDGRELAQECLPLTEGLYQMLVNTYVLDKLRPQSCRHAIQVVVLPALRCIKLTLILGNSQEDEEEVNFLTAFETEFGKLNTSPQFRELDVDSFRAFLNIWDDQVCFRMANKAKKSPGTIDNFVKACEEEAHKWLRRVGKATGKPLRW